MRPAKISWIILCVSSLPRTTRKRANNELKSTQQEIEQLKKSIQEAEVTSEIDGVVKSINDSSDDSAGYSGSSSDEFQCVYDAFIDRTLPHQR